MSVSLKRGTLYFFKQEGCPACESGGKILDQFRASTEKHRDKLMIIELDVSKNPRWSVHGWSPKATPSYLLAVNGRPTDEHEGAMTIKQLEKFTAALLAKGN